MKIVSQQAYSSVYIPKKQNESSNVATESLFTTKEINTFKNSKCVYEDKNIVPYSIVYNDATLENSNNKIISSSEDKMSDEELAFKLDKDLYDHSDLSSKGIKFNSNEFKNWLKEQKKSLVVPPDAPPKIRKALTDTLDSLKKKDEVAWFRTCRAIHRGLKGYDTTKTSSYSKVFNDILQDSKDYITSINISGLSNSSIFKDGIRVKQNMIEVFTKLKSKIESSL
ncbi:hypothetical protein NNC19_18090 [Clostridium sp. SHJSY1]|uniref:hypothetical protein n=1 Tax=Clostridium sp. SHJSY1 TaxID=2942483 RepID=UPI002876C175|nr:hypothetical protein [Clostridium sp. SHJSY1]MDS0527604.1 hypothetical protein [Clostridium sp. SHJSY1]